MSSYGSVADIASLIARYVQPRNPALVWGLIAVESVSAGVTIVRVQRENATRRALYLPIIPPVVGGGVWVTDTGTPNGLPVVIEANYQVPWEPTFLESPLMMTETDPGADGILGTWDDIHYLMVDDDGYYLTEG